MGIVEGKENVDHPSHYTMGGIEVIDVIEAWDLSFSLGCVLKYIARARHKWTDYSLEEEIQDLKKGIWYLTRELEWRTKCIEKENGNIKNLSMKVQHQKSVGRNNMASLVEKFSEAIDNSLDNNVVIEGYIADEIESFLDLAESVEIFIRHPESNQLTYTDDNGEEVTEDRWDIFTKFKNVVEKLNRNIDEGE